MSRVAGLGYHWHVATVMAGAGPGGQAGGTAVFVGPFTTDDWPSRDFSTLLAIIKPSDAQRGAWLRSTGMEQVGEWKLVQGRVGRLYRTVDVQPLKIIGGGAAGGGPGGKGPAGMPPDSQGGGPP